jgi:hypothetical protein
MGQRSGNDVDGGLTVGPNFSTLAAMDRPTIPGGYSGPSWNSIVKSCDNVATLYGSLSRAAYKKLAKLAQHRISNAGIVSDAPEADGSLGAVVGEK